MLRSSFCERYHWYQHHSKSSSLWESILMSTSSFSVGYRYIDIIIGLAIYKGRYWYCHCVYDIVDIDIKAGLGHIFPSVEFQWLLCGFQWRVAWLHNASVIHITDQIVGRTAIQLTGNLRTVSNGTHMDVFEQLISSWRFHNIYRVKVRVPWCFILDTVHNSLGSDSPSYILSHIFTITSQATQIVWIFCQNIYPSWAEA